MLVGDRERDRARARADVEDRGASSPRSCASAALDDHLRLGPRDQRAPVDRERQPPEPPLAEDVRRRLVVARGARRARGRRPARPRQRPVEVGVELDPRSAEHVREQELGVEARRSPRSSPRCSACAPEYLAPGSAARRGHSSSRRPPVFLLQRRGELVQPALKNLVEAERQLDPVVGERGCRG